MEECRYEKECREVKQFHLEIIDRLARIETKQDNVSGLHAAYQHELAQLQQTSTAQGKEITVLNQEIKNFKWLAGIIAGSVAGLIQSLAFVFKKG